MFLVTQNDYVTRVGNVPNSEGVSLIFCNGAGYTKEVAKKSATLLSEALNNQVVTWFYNPTGINKNPDQNLEPPDVQTLARLFAETIKTEINQHVASGCERVAIRISLFLHSHAGLIALNAMDYLSEEDKRTLEIYSFGSVKMFPKSIGRQAINYVHENDLIAEGASLVDKEPSLYNFKQICGQEKAGINKFLAVFKLAEMDLFRHVSPNRENYSLETQEEREGKDKRYQQIFLNPASDGQALMNDPLFQSRCQYYCSLLNDYTIVMLTGIPRDPIEAPTFIDFCKSNLKGVAVNAYKNHQFPAYISSVFDGKFRSKF